MSLKTPQINNRWECSAKQRNGRVPESILKNKFIDKKCARKGCSVHFVSTKQMYRCKGLSLPIGYNDNPEFMSVLVRELENEDLKISDGCDNTDDR
jgi:hypothetical protein